MDLEALRRMLREGKAAEPAKAKEKPWKTKAPKGWSSEDFYRHKKGQKSLAEILNGPPDHPTCRCTTKLDPTEGLTFNYLHECQGDHGPDGPGGVATAWIPSMTRYPDEKPTSGWWFCRDCAIQYIEEWTERWDEYRAGQF